MAMPSSMASRRTEATSLAASVMVGETRPPDWEAGAPAPRVAMADPELVSPTDRLRGGLTTGAFLRTRIGRLILPGAGDAKAARPPSARHVG